MISSATREPVRRIAPLGHLVRSGVSVKFMLGIVPLAYMKHKRGVLRGCLVGVAIGRAFFAALFGVGGAGFGGGVFDFGVYFAAD